MIRRWRERRIYRWWILFERARLFELRRGWFWCVFMAEIELATIASQITRPDLQHRIFMAKLRHEARAILRDKRKATP